MATVYVFSYAPPTLWEDLPRINAGPMLEVVVGLIHGSEHGVKWHLLTKRLPHQPGSNKWCFPGGKVESNENHHQALAREMHEELLMSVDIGARVYEAVAHLDGIPFKLSYYECSAWSMPQCTPDVAAVGLVPTVNLMQHDLLATDKIVAKKLVLDALLHSPQPSNLAETAFVWKATYFTRLFCFLPHAS